MGNTVTDYQANCTDTRTMITVHQVTLRISVALAAFTLSCCSAETRITIATFSSVDGILKYSFNKKHDVAWSATEGVITAHLTLTDGDWIDFNIDRPNKLLTTNTHFTKKRDYEVKLECTDDGHGFISTDNPIDGEWLLSKFLNSHGQKISVSWK
jgi:hypothetical protein